MRAYERLQQWWTDTSKKVSLELPSASDVEELERRYTLTLPEDFRDYLLNSCPTHDAWDAENSTWWDFGRIKNITEEYGHKLHEQSVAAHASQYLVFADHCIWCWAWAIAYTNDNNHGKIALIGGNPDRFVANSFATFVKAYTTNFRSVC